MATRADRTEVPRELGNTHPYELIEGGVYTCHGNVLLGTIHGSAVTEANVEAAKERLRTIKGPVTFEVVERRQFGFVPWYYATVLGDVHRTGWVNGMCLLGKKINRGQEGSE
jgi:hypothetical protein